MALEDPGIPSRMEPTVGWGGGEWLTNFYYALPAPWPFPQPFATFVKDLDGPLWPQGSPFPLHKR